MRRTSWSMSKGTCIIALHFTSWLDASRPIGLHVCFYALHGCNWNHQCGYQFHSIVVTGDWSNSRLCRQLRNWVQVHIKTCKHGGTSKFKTWDDTWGLSFLGAPCICLSLYGTHNHIHIPNVQYVGANNKVSKLQQMVRYLLVRMTWICDNKVR